MADPLRVLSLFSGIGGLDIGLTDGARRVGLETRHVGMVEGEAFSCAALAAAMQAGRLAPCPIWLGDIREFPAAAFRGSVDLVVGGFPCQDISLAGKGEGLDGDRSGLWFDMLRLAVRVGARYLFVENVSAITSRGLDAVLGSLAEVGFDAEWTCVRASDVGAPHRRERWFCLAYAANERHERSWRARDGRDGPADGGIALPAWPPRPDDAEGWRCVLERWPELAPAIDFGRPVDDTSSGRHGIADDSVRTGRDSPLGAGGEREAATQPDVRGVAHGAANRVDRLRGLGNAVVPQCASAAFSHLWTRMGKAQA